jgi:tetratricopeptide (TPR) repeat protein
MPRLLLTIALLLCFLPAAAQQDTTVTQPSPQPPADTTQPNPPDTTQPNKKNKVMHKAAEAIPDCVNLIFYIGCRHSDRRQQDADERAARERADAAKRCEQLTEARSKQVATKPTTDHPTLPEVPNGESSSRTSLPPEPEQPYCTPESVLAAAHDVEVGDFNMNNKNYRGAEMRYRSALEGLPDDPVATLHLARLLEKQGRKAEALRLYQSYMTWSPTGKEAAEAQAAITRLENRG